MGVQTRRLWSEISAVMVRHDRSRRSVKGHPTDMYDDTRPLTTQSYHISYLPLPVLLPSIPWPASDSCDTTVYLYLHPDIIRVPCTSVICLLCVSNDSQDNSRKPSPSPSLCYSLTHLHRSIGYLHIPQSLSESVERLTYLRVYDSRNISSRPHPPRRPYDTHSHIHTGPLVITTSTNLWLTPPWD